MTAPRRDPLPSQEAAPLPVCPRADDAPLFVIGSLPAEEHEAFRSHLEEGCVDCARELRAAREAAARLDLEVALAEEPRMPPLPAEMRERLIALALAEGSFAARPEDAPAFERAWQSWSAESGRPAGAVSVGGLTFVPASGQGWQRTPVAGVEVRPLAVDAARRAVTMLVRMAPGSSYPRHRHGGREECYVIEGDLQVGERTMSTGDYQLAEVGSVHGVQSTEGGCTLFIVSSQDDQLL